MLFLTHLFRQVYEPEKRKWAKLAPMPTKRAGTCAVAVGDKIVAMGGVAVDQKPLDTVEVFDTKTKKWEAKSSLRENLLGLSAVVRGTFNMAKNFAVITELLQYIIIVSDFEKAVASFLSSECVLDKSSNCCRWEGVCDWWHGSRYKPARHPDEL